MTRVRRVKYAKVWFDSYSGISNGVEVDSADMATLDFLLSLCICFACSDYRKNIHDLNPCS